MIGKHAVVVLAKGVPQAVAQTAVIIGFDVRNTVTGTPNFDTVFFVIVRQTNHTNRNGE